MARGPAEAAKLIPTVVAVDAPPRQTRDVLLHIINQKGWFLGSQAEDQAEVWLPRFVSRAQFLITSLLDSGHHVSFCFNSSGFDYLQGSCYPEPSDADHIVEAKRRRANTARIFERCQTLTPEQFEQLSGKILLLLKVDTPFVSRRTADQGIDFFGRVSFGQIIKPSFLPGGAEKNMSVWLLGQAKHYPETKIGTGEIRELVGSVELARAKIFAGTVDPLSELTARLCDPIIYIFFTSGRYSRDSIDLISKSGVLSFDGLQIGQFLADHGIGLVDGAFDSASFEKWLAN